MSNKFVNAAKAEGNKGLTANGGATLKSSLDRNVDLFFMIGNRNKDFTQEFRAAYQEDPDLATRILLWARDVRGGAGERATFRTILAFLEKHDFAQFKRVLPKVPEIGRWDDVLVSSTPPGQKLAASLIHRALLNGDGLCAKWMPREHANNKQKRAQARGLAKFMGLTPRQYRKLLSNTSSTVEQKMCAKEWEAINYSKLPSLASARYKKAFLKNDEKRFREYSEALSSGAAGVKVNAGAVYPYDVIKSMKYSRDPAAVNVATAQWEALPNLVGDAKILPMVDVSGSMTCQVGDNPNLRCIDVSVSLGLYLADKNTGEFAGTCLTFSTTPKLQHLTGDLPTKYREITNNSWWGSTDIMAAFREVLRVAKANMVPKEDMPDYLLILSDMEFNSITTGGQSVTAFNAMRSEYLKAGYPLPKVVFWNLNSRAGNTPVTHMQTGTALVSGFSPNILKAVLSGDLENYSPKSIMLKAVMIDRYDLG